MSLLLALTGGSGSVTAEIAWTESDDAWAIVGEIAAPVVDAAIAWTEDDDQWAVIGAIQTPVAPAASGGGGGGGWLGATQEEERRLLAQIEAVLRETLAPKKAAPLLRELAGVQAVAEVRAQVQRMADEAKADAQLQEVLADVQARIAIFVARKRRQRDDEELMMVL